MINLAKTFAWNLQVRKITNLKFRALLKVLKTLNSKRPMSDRTARTKTEPLRLSISWAFGENILPNNPLGKIKLLKVSNSKQVIINDDDVDELISLLAKRPFRIPFLLAVHGGLRREEAAALRDCVDFKRNTITILEAQPRTISGKRLQKDPKSDASSRTI